MGFTLIFIGTSSSLALPEERETDFWLFKTLKAVQGSVSLALALARSRTHVCYYDEETWIRDGGARCTRRD